MDYVRALALRMSCVLILGFMIGRAAAKLEFGSCKQEYIWPEILDCKGEFVKAMNESTSATSECPSFYEDAKACVENQVIKPCDKDNTQDDNSTRPLWDALGSQEYFCTYGLLKSMRVAFEGEVNCENENYNNYSKCEDPFYAAFKRQFADGSNKTEDMNTLYNEARTCQHFTAEYCKISDTEFLGSEFFNPYDKEAVESLSRATKIIEVDGVPSSANTTYITIAVVAILLIAVLCLTFYLLWRRDQTRAERRRKKAEERKRAASGVVPAGSAGTEMQPLAGQAVVTTTDEVAPAQEC